MSQELVRTMRCPHTGTDDIAGRLVADLNDAEAKAFDALSRYKFQMFGYWAAIWVHLNRIGGFKRPNPFAQLVQAARQHVQVLT